jgi:hypothetical protein
MVFIILLQQPPSIFGIKSSGFNRQVKSIYDKRLFFEDRRLMPSADISPMLIFDMKRLQCAHRQKEVPIWSGLVECVKFGQSFQGFLDVTQCCKQYSGLRRLSSVRRNSTCLAGKDSGGGCNSRQTGQRWIFSAISGVTSKNCDGKAETEHNMAAMTI